MPFELSVDPERRLIMLIGRGRAELRDALDAVERLAACARQYAQYLLLSDSRELDYEPKIPELQEIARAMFARRELVTRRLAIVVKSGVQEQAGRMLAAMSSYVGMRIEVFTDVDNAIFWLNFGRR